MSIAHNDTEHRRLDVVLGEPLLDRAYQAAVAIFAGWELTPSNLSIEIKGGNSLLDTSREVVPPIAFALRYFGEKLPPALIAKLRNKPQTENSLFELLCLGLLAERHTVLYEPKLPDGKVPDLLVELEDGTSIYVECKAHGFIESQSWRVFNDVASQLFKAFAGEPITKASEKEQLRLEVLLKAKPSPKEFEEMKVAIRLLTLEDIRVEKMLSGNLSLIAIPRGQPVRNNFSLKAGVQTFGPAPTQVLVEHCGVLVYSWPRLDQLRLQAQRALLAEARVQLRNIPPGAFGMVCIKTVSANRFLPVIHELIDQEQFNRIPIVWLNPSLLGETESKIVYRDTAKQNGVQ